MIEEYYNNLKMLNILEKMFSSKSFSEKYKGLGEDVTDLKDAVNPKESLEASKDTESDGNNSNPELKKYKDMRGLNEDQKKEVSEIIDNYNSYSGGEIKSRIDKIIEKAPHDWSPNDEFIDFYNESLSGESLMPDIYSLGSMFIGIDRDYLVTAKAALNPLGYLFNDIAGHIIPGDYNYAMNKTFSTIDNAVGSENKILFYESFMRNMGGEDEFTKSLIQIGTKDDYVKDVAYEGGEVSLSPSDANEARKNIGVALFLALKDLTFGFDEDRRKEVTSKIIQFPVEDGVITSRYGNRLDPIKRRKGEYVQKFHSGLDIGAKKGAEIKSIMTGTVVSSGRKGGYGLTICVSHADGYKSCYSHCNKLFLNVGDYVGLDTVIALVGSTGRSTGPHLHLEVTKDGSKVDPMKLLSRER